MKHAKIPQRNQKILALLKEGKSYEVLRKRFGMTRQMISLIAKSFNFKPVKKGHTLYDFTCKNCGKAFQRNYRTARFCSRKCVYETYNVPKRSVEYWKEYRRNYYQTVVKKRISDRRKKLISEYYGTSNNKK